MPKFVDIFFPEKIDVYHHRASMHIVRKWFSWWEKLISIGVVTVYWYSTVYVVYPYTNKEVDLISKLFSLTPEVVGICIAYYIIAGWFNRTNIFISKNTIDVEHYPVPWLGNRRLKATDIKQIYGKEKIRYFGRSEETSPRYEVHVITNNGRNIKLLSSLDSSEQALFIEREIEKYLGIKNIAVRGEIAS